MTTQERIKLALDIHNRIQNIKAIDAELTKYNLPVLQKSAALGAHKEERIKLAALLQQRSLEKQAIMGMLGGAAKMLGKGLMGGAKAGVGAGKAIGRGIAKNPMAAATGIGGLGLGAAGMAAANPAMRAINSGVNQARSMYDQGKAIAGGAAQGAQQGLESMGQGVLGAGNQLFKGFTGQLGQNALPGGLRGAAPEFASRLGGMLGAGSRLFTGQLGKQMQQLGMPIGKQMPQRRMPNYGRSNSPLGATPGIAPPQQSNPLAMGAR